MSCQQIYEYVNVESKQHRARSVSETACIVYMALSLVGRSLLFKATMDKYISTNHRRNNKVKDECIMYVEYMQNSDIHMHDKEVSFFNYLKRYIYQSNKHRCMNR